MRPRRAVALVRWLVLFTVIAALSAGAYLLIARWVRPQVSVTRVIEGPVVQAFYATGTLQPHREYPIKANAPGILTQVLVDKGDVVRKDQPLAIVYEDGVQYRFEQARADRDLKARLADEKLSPLLKEFDQRLAGAEQLLQIALRERDRITAALSGGAASPSDQDRALDRVRALQTEIEGLRAQRAAKKLELDKDLEVAEAALNIARWNLDRQTLRCPIEQGSVLDRPLPVGTRVAVNDHVMQIADVRPEKLVMRSSVDEEDKTHVRMGQVVHMALYAFPGRTFEGRVIRIYDKADPDRRTFEVDVEPVEKQAAFAAGMTGELAFVIEQKPSASLIPSQAVQNGRVWVVRDGRLAALDVRLGLRSVERTEVIAGLDPRDQVVISPVGAMTEGQRVLARLVNPVDAAALNRSASDAGSNFRGFR